MLPLTKIRKKQKRSDKRKKEATEMQIENVASKNGVSKIYQGDYELTKRLPGSFEGNFK